MALEKYIKPLEITPTSTAIALQRLGLEFFKQPTLESMADVIQEINSTRLKIYFPNFWTRQQTVLFREIVRENLDEDALAFVIKGVETKCAMRPTHWIEEINLFRLYGLMRFKSSVDIQFLRTENQPKHLAFPLISAKNSMIIREPENDQLVNSAVANLLRNELTRQHAEFTIHYYDGIDNTLDAMLSYIGTPTQGTIPVTLSSLFSTFKLSKRQVEFVSDAVIGKLPLKLQRTIQKRTPREKQVKG